MDGYDLAREIRRIEAATGVTKPIPIIACTANAMESDAKACHDAGMNDYLSKPTTLEALKAKIEHWVTADTAAKPIPAEDTPTATAAVAVAPLEEPPLDANTLAEFTGGDASLRREILRQFLASHEPDTIALRAALSSGNCSSIADAAHRVKGSSRMVGAQPYADVAERIESAARNYDQIAVNNCIADLEKEQARLSAYLRAETGDA